MAEGNKKRKQPSVEDTRTPNYAPPSSPTYAFDFLGNAMGNVLGNVGKGVKSAWDFTTDELLGVDDFTRAKEADNWGDRGKSLATGAAELGLTFAGGPIIKGVSKVASPVVKAVSESIPAVKPAMDLAGNVVSDVGKTVKQFPQTVAKAAAVPMIALSGLAGAGGAVGKAALEGVNAGRTAITRVIDDAGNYLGKSGEEFAQGASDAASTVVKAGQQAVENVGKTVSNAAENVADWAKGFLGPVVNVSDRTINPQVQQMQQQQQQQQQASGGNAGGSGGSGRPAGEGTARKPRRVLPLPGGQITGMDVEVPYTY